jgi:flagellar biosynthesis regulator FlaF
MKKHAIMGFAAILLLLPGCQEGQFDDQLKDIAVKQNTHEKDLNQIAWKMEGVTRRLERIEGSLEKLSPASGSPEAPTTVETEPLGPQVVEFKDTPEYKQIVARLSTIQQELSLTQSNLVGTEEDAATQRERAQMTDPAQMMQAMRDPKQLSSRLDALVQNFAQNIEDPVKRQQFEAEVHQFKRSLSQNVTDQQLYQQVYNDLTERLNAEQNERAREYIQREIRSLESASGEELAGRLDRYTRLQNFRQLRDLTQTYEIPREVLLDSGLPAMGGQPGRPEGRRGQGRGGRR